MDNPAAAFFRKAVVITFHLLFLLLPFIWVSNTFELFEYPKMMCVYALSTLIAALWGSRMIASRKILVTRTYLDLPLLLFLASQVISTVISIDPHTSLWGYYSRFNGGLFSTLSYFTLFYAAVSNFTKQDAVNLLKTIIASAVMTSLYSAPEHFGHSPSCFMITASFDAKCWVQDVQTRVFGTFGQPNWQAAYLITIIFIPLAQILEVANSKQKEKRKKNFPYYILPTAYYILFFLVLLFTKSRSGLLGFALGSAIFAALTYFSSQTKKAVFRLLLAAFCLLLIVFFAFGEGIFAQADRLTAPLRDTVIALTKPKNQPLATVHEPKAIGGTQLEVGGTESGKIREIVWTGALKLFLKYPLFGSGVETYGYAYYNVRPITHNLVSEWDFLYNKAHNEFLNYLATSGLFGLGSYLSIIIVYTIWTIKLLMANGKWQMDKNHVPPATSYLLAALIAGFASLSVSNFFGFSTVPVVTLFFLFPALAWLLSQPEETKNSKQRAMKKYDSPHILPTTYYLLLIPWIIALFLWIHLGTMYRADTLFAKGKQYLDQGDVANSYNLLKQAVTAMPGEAEYTDQFSLAAAKGATSLERMNQATSAAQLAVQAEQFSNRTLQLNRVHLNFYKTRIRVFVELAALNAVQYMPKAEAALKQALTLAPTDAKLWYNLGLMYTQINQTEAARKTLEQTITLKPNYEAARQDLAKIYLKLNQPEEAKKQYQFILQHINPNNPDAKAYLQNKP